MMFNLRGQLTHFTGQQKVEKQVANSWINVSIYDSTRYLIVKAHIWEYPKLDVYFTDQTCTIYRSHKKS